MIENNFARKVNGGGYEIIVKIVEKNKVQSVGNSKVAICPECGYVETYIEDFNNDKK
ncbi:hypothetical protein RV10_GL001023 [Enterococcus pallens]|nr:hypothetical protein RV10_GL001023 [Enterococcus pallens]